MQKCDVKTCARWAKLGDVYPGKVAVVHYMAVAELTGMQYETYALITPDDTALVVPKYLAMSLDPWCSEPRHYVVRLLRNNRYYNIVALYTGILTELDAKLVRDMAKSKRSHEGSRG